MTRSKAQPASAPNAVAAAIAAISATMFMAALPPDTQTPNHASTLAAMKAPKETKAEWPKFNTSISPKISDRPDAIRKIIMPMARPATVSVIQVDGRPISTKAMRPSATGRSMTPPKRSKVAERVFMLAVSSRTLGQSQKASPYVAPLCPAGQRGA